MLSMVNFFQEFRMRTRREDLVSSPEPLGIFDVKLFHTLSTGKLLPDGCDRCKNVVKNVKYCISMMRTLVKQKVKKNKRTIDRKQKK